MLQKYYRHEKNKVYYCSRTVKNKIRANVCFVWLKMIYCGICNSDIKEIRAERLTRKDFGHEYLAKIISANGIELIENTFVTLDPHIKLAKRDTGFANLSYLECDKVSLDRALHKLPSSDISFVLVEPLACAIHAVKRLLHSRKDYQKILIYGAGTFGYLIYCLLSVKGYHVTLANRTHERLIFLKKLNEDLHINNLYGDDYDAIIFSQSFLSFTEIKKLLYKMKFCKDILIFSAVHKTEPYNLYKIRNDELIKSFTLYKRTIKLIGTLGASSYDFKDAILMLSNKFFCDMAKKIITKISSPEEGVAILNSMANGESEFGKTIIQFGME